ncbi:MAG: betaine/proline/choline family ABC transporter ATP-binding protein [Bacillus sp. (in: Bacteria)]|nr:betaine/proline/choline family ABC transporter ATP-binding protein [Bacillus sp. (in: firmicutes)]
MIKFERVVKRFEDGFEAIKGIDLHIPKGEFVALIGPSGCGKTTTMKMINKLILPTEGAIYIDGQNIAYHDEVELRRNIGYVIQQIGLLPHMTVGENIALIPKLKGWKKEKYEKRVDELLDLVGLDPSVFKHRYPLELSGGQQQRVGVVRALAAEPPIILMDEPFSALDPISREQLQDELKQIQQSIQKTIVFVTHDMDEALKLADRIAVMREGRIEQYTTPEELITQPANDFVRSFIGEHRLKEQVKTIEPFIEEPIVVPVHFTKKEVLEWLLTRSVNEVFVVNESDKVIGIISRRKLEQSNLSSTDPIESLTQPLPILLSPHTTLSEAAKAMVMQNLSIAPVGKNTHFLGMITRENLLLAFSQQQEEEAVLV